MDNILEFATKHAWLASGTIAMALVVIFYELRQKFIDWNFKVWDSAEFKSQEKEIDSFLKDKIKALEVINEKSP